MSCDAGDFMCVVNNCSGGIGSGSLLFNYWRENNCPAAYAQAINTGTGGILSYNQEQQKAMQVKVVELFNTYLETNEITDDVTSTSYNSFQNTLLSLCLDPSLPGICSLFLGGTGNTGGYCSQYTRDQVNNSPTLINFCGCYVPPDPVYLQYTLASEECSMGLSGCTSGCTAGTPGCTGQPACDPLCHRALTSQKANVENGVIITCPQSICVIDDVTINITNSQVPGGINFNTLCSGCGAGCLCIVSGTNISTTMSQIGVGTDFNQFCGSNSVCIVEDSQGNVISEGGCTGINPINMDRSPFSYLPNLGLVFIVILTVLIILFVVITVRFSRPKVLMKI